MSNNEPSRPHHIILGFMFGSLLSLAFWALLGVIVFAIWWSHR